ncbi:MAG: glycine--tRNA ligase subunit beta [Gammaproteobacteria bacterium]|nr:glycine--tRNA ligase subunit beta [Gammaproteobacteria bacterium]
MQDTLLIELLTEELPPKSLNTLGQVFASGIFEELKKRGFVADGGFTAYATPRRLAVSVEGVQDRQPDQNLTRKGPAVAAGFDAEGKPTPALAGFAKSCGTDVAALEKHSDGKAEFFAFRSTRAGEQLEQHLAGIVEGVLKKLPIPKMMRWGDSDVQFVRPVHGLVMLHGDRIVPGEVLGLSSGNKTLGHRFLSKGEILVSRADQYEQALQEQGSVIAGFDRRMDAIKAGLEQAAGEAVLAEHEALLPEVAALVEYPAVYAGNFNPEFLKVPQECLILSMQQHQKYFPLLDKGGKLLPRFLLVSNLKTADPSHIIHGNERVLRARLSDAKFFFEQDQKTRLDARVEKLGNVVYHNRLGTQLERVNRIRKLAGEIARRLSASAELAERAGYLCKADLLTDMVGEFPELQGIMGQYYALHDGERDEVAHAIEAHYHPRFAGDALPQDNIGAAVALADKLDTLVGIYGIGLVPTGDKDPFGLRRHALGVLRILAESSLPLDLVQLLQQAKSLFPAEMLADSVAVDVHGFMLERLKNYLRDKDFAPDEIEAVVGQAPTRIDLVVPRLEAVRAFRKMPEAAALAAANKRIQNILKKTAAPVGQVDIALLQEDAEKALFAAVNELAPGVVSWVGNGGYTEALTALAGVRAEVDTFFDKVMVMAEEPLLRNNRLALLKSLGELMNQVADISKLAA